MKENESEEDNFRKLDARYKLSTWHQPNTKAIIVNSSSTNGALGLCSLKQPSVSQVPSFPAPKEDVPHRRASARTECVPSTQISNPESVKRI
ncbi:hypothetical protein C8R42DRAFT_660904 [Lentinula raphanica]|nr:hypothetical protein C8R42DRAFT_660904 [Lentinula raphanica]